MELLTYCPFEPLEPRTLLNFGCAIPAKGEGDMHTSTAWQSAAEIVSHPLVDFLAGALTGLGVSRKNTPLIITGGTACIISYIVGWAAQEELHDATQILPLQNLGLSSVFIAFIVYRRIQGAPLIPTTPECADLTNSY